jgi:4-hydroxy-2-oxoglutarate aldolase
VREASADGKHSTARLLADTLRGMTTRTLGGLLAPAVTTFDRATGELSREPFVRNLKAHLDAGLDGILVAGSSGEAALLDSSERRTITEWAREVVTPEQWLLVGTGSESTRETIARCRDAKAAGADAVLVVAPHYFLKRMTEAALLAHYRAVADASPLPVLLYNMPAYAHLVLSPELVHTMAQHDNVIGMKDSAGNLTVLEQYLAAQSDTFTVLTGHGGTTASAIARGARGAILAISLYGGLLTRAMVDAALAGRHEEAAALQLPLVPLAAEIAAAFGPPGLKAAMDMVGLDGGAPRSPLQPLDADERAKVEDALRRGGVLLAA